VPIAGTSAPDCTGLNKLENLTLTLMCISILPIVIAIPISGFPEIPFFPQSRKSGIFPAKIPEILDFHFLHYLNKLGQTCGGQLFKCHLRQYSTVDSSLYSRPRLGLLVYHSFFIVLPVAIDRSRSTILNKQLRSLLFLLSLVTLL